MKRINKLQEEYLNKLILLVEEYADKTIPTKIYLSFKKENNDPLIIETRFPIPDDNVIVMISNIKKDWQAPFSGTKDIGNPKIKEMSREDFDKTFNIYFYHVEEDNINIISLLKMSKKIFEYNGKQKTIGFHN